MEITGKGVQDGVFPVRGDAAAKPPYGRLRTLAGDKFTAVFVNGAYMGHAGEFNNPVQGLLLNPGEYVVKIVPPGRAVHKRRSPSGPTKLPS